MNETNLLKDFYSVINSEFFNESPICAFIWRNDQHWSVESVSKNVYSLLGYKKDDFVSAKLVYANLIHPKDMNRVMKEVEEASTLRLKKFVHEPYRVKRDDGKYIWVNDTTSIVYKNEEISHFIGYISDCTAEIEAKEHVESSKQMWVNAIESNGDGLWEWNTKTNEVYFSPQWKKMLGFDVDEISGNIEEWEKRVHPDDIQNVKNDINAYLSGKSTRYVNEHRVLCKDGMYKWILDKGSATKYSEDGSIESLTGTHSDITQKYKNQEKIKQLKKQFENMFHNHDAMMFLINPIDGSIVDVNNI